MTSPATASRSANLRLDVALGLAAGGLFVADLSVGNPHTLSTLYVIVLLMAYGSGCRDKLLQVAWLCLALTVSSFLLRYILRREIVSIWDLAVSLSVVGLAIPILLRNLRQTLILQDQAGLLDKTHDSITVRDLSGRLTYWNAAAAALYGWTARDVQGKLARELLKTGYPVPEEQILGEVLSDGLWEGELRNCTADGRDLIMESRWSLLRDERGKPASILETGNDITQRKLASYELEISEVRYRNIFQTMAVAIWECDFSRVKRRCDELWQEGVRDFRQYVRENPTFVREAINLSRAVDVNPASVRLFAAPSREILLNEFGLVWPADGEWVYAEAMFAALTNQAIFETEAVLQTIDGRRLDLLFTASFPPGTEERQSIFVAVVDITASNRARAELHSAQVDLAHAMRLTSLGELTATIAHEVNQPLGGIVANGRAALRWLQRSPPELGEVKNSIEQTVAEALRAANVLGNIRAMARKSEPQLAPLEINGLIRETIGLLAREIRRADVTLDLDLEDGIAPAIADRIQVQQVLINLILNSVQAMNDVRGRLRTLSISTNSRDDMMTVRIDDNGHGIAPEQRDRLLTPFFTTKTEGVGIGLSVCGSIIERHGGHIGLHEKNEPGLCIEFSLPLSTAGRDE